MVLQTTGWESHNIDFYTFGSQNVYVMGPSMAGQDWTTLKLRKTACLAVPEAIQLTLQGNQYSGAQTFSQLHVSFLTKLSGNGRQEVSSSCVKDPVSTMKDLWPVFQLQVFLVSVSAEILSSLLSSAPVRSPRRMRRGDEVRTGTEIWHRAQLSCQHSERMGRHVMLPPDPSSKLQDLHLM